MKGIDMKKTAVLLAVLMLCGLTGCKGKNSGSSEVSSGTPDTTAAASGAAEDTTEESTEEGTAAVTEKASSAETAAASATGKAKGEKTTDVSTAAADGGQTLFEYNPDGALNFNAPAEEQSDSDIIAAGQALFRSACETDWSFTVGSPYELDMSKYVENQYGWQFYLVTTPGKNSVADVEKDYYKVFSDRYPTALSEVFMDDGGRVYSLNGERGINSFYQYSQITEIKSRTEDEIFFNVRNYYDGTPFGGPEPYQTDEDFSAVIGSDGVWKVGKFRLPY